MARAHNRQAGFTLAELMISISIFTVALVMITSSAILIGKLYRQGATKTKMLTASREIHAQFTQLVQYSGKKINPTSTNLPAPDQTWSVACFGNTRYRWQLGVANAFYADNLTTATNLNCDSPIANITTYVQPLPVGSIVTAFGVTGSNSLYTLNTRFVIGSNDMFEGNDYNNKCNNNLLGSEFCSVVSMQSSAARKVSN